MIKKVPSILLVEDDKYAQESLSSFINKISEKCYIATNGYEAIEMYEEHKPAVILSDINMPKLNGIEMAKKIKMIDPEQIVILITAHTESEFLIEAIDLNIDGYIIKPIFVEKLHAKIIDIYEKKRLKDDLQLQQKIIIQSEKLVSMGEMVGNIAHQWRQPLNALSSLLANLEIKHESKNLDEEFYKRFFEKSDSLIQRMSQTIDDFINFFSPDKEKQEFNLNKLLEDSLEFFNNYIKEKLVINLKCNDNITLMSYKNEFMQVILNILNNSYDAIKEKNIENKKIDIIVNESENKIEVLIQDYAGGIEDDIIERIFEPYFTTKYKSDGTGIGLYMCKMIVENSMGGVINIENKSNGLLTRITIPK